MPLKIELHEATGHRWKYKDLKTLAEAIGGQEAAKATFAPPRWSLPPARRGRKAELKMRVELHVRMPVWTKRDSRPKAERDEWDRFLKALRFHEDGHIAIYRREFPKVFDRLKRVAPDEVGDALAEEVAKIWDLDEQYDADTTHGETQDTPYGTTVINPP